MKNIIVSEGRFRWVAAVVCLSFLGFFGRLCYLQGYAQDTFLQMGKDNRQQFRVIHARRGSIIDAQGGLLAATRPVIDIGVDPLVFQDPQMPQLEALGQGLGLAPMTVQEALRDGRASGRRWVLLAKGVDEAAYERVKRFEVKGVYGTLRYERVYPGGALAAHMIGFVNHEDQPSMGVERAMDFYLRGHSGWVEAEKDGKRKEIAHSRSRSVAATDGFHVKLSLDTQIQAFCEEEVQTILTEFSPLAVSIIASEPMSGRILALANAPSFDLNAYGKAPLEAQRNRALCDTYEPGSCFKVVTMTAALEHKCIHSKESFDCSKAVITHEGRDIKLPKDHKPFGMLSAEEIFIKSSNRAMAQLGLRMGPHALYEMAARFGFGERSGLGLLGEVSGILHPVKRWDGLTITRMPMGHAIGATALQTHMAMSAIAADGLLMRPQIVTDILGQDLEPLLHFDPIVRRRVCSPKIAQVLKNLLMRAAEPGGTSFRAYVPGFGVALKSGTTQKLIGKRYSRTHHVASASGFFPASHPRVCLTIVIDEPHLQGTGYGGVVAAPSFKRLALKMIPYLKIERLAPLTQALPRVTAA